MTPTNELRFVERQVPITENVSKTVIILQQKWVLYWSEDSGGGERESEWRDVPVEKEPKQ